MLGTSDLYPMLQDTTLKDTVAAAIRELLAGGGSADTAKKAEGKGELYVALPN